MGDSFQHSVRRSSVVASGKDSFPKGSLVAAIPRAIQQTIYKNVSFSRNGGIGIGSGTLQNAAVFLLKVAVLEVVRRVSKAKCPHLWNTLQALQCFCYPPLKWIRRWAPFRDFIKAMQMLSRPLLVLTIAEALTDQSESKQEASNASSEAESEAQTSQSLSDIRIEDEATRPATSQDWLKQLYEELEKQRLSLPERINEDELHRFYRVSNGDFTSLLSSIKKTIRWRETYTILSEEELETWSSLVFWHGYDRNQRPCLVVRLGLAFLKLPSHERPRFAQAIISQVEHGVLHLLNPENSELTVLVDCEGLSPLRIPMQMLRSCSSILQDHFPNRLGCLFIIRLPPVVRVISQTFIQILRPSTRKKLRIEGETFHRVLSEYLQTLPSYLGSDCNCKRCSNLSGQDSPQTHTRSKTGSSRETEQLDISGWSYNVQTPDLAYEGDPSPNVCTQVLRTAIVFVLMLWLLGVLIAGFVDPESRPF
ncbi:SEC14 cytosolic factor family protein / phosphoglyceride transfer family protein [Hirschfeldia incana]|nr:SEC14 cytosolic factor family protein / phosphoglyceride transfer family protein [Hirschfeldia incana]KAJ0241662.1 SEC14 cytosolic factor family protein / phosphoglyceride transfer family protein [Hirschfeldia incana]